MRVIHVNKYFYPPHLGGIEQTVLWLARALVRRPDFSVTAVVANEGRETVRETVEGIDVLRVGRTVAVSSTPVALGLERALRAEATADPAADLIHLNFPYPWGEISWLRSGLPQPTVLTYHSDIVRQRVLGGVYAPILRRVLERVDRIMVGSPQLVQHSPFLRPHADKCRVVPFGIDVDRSLGDEDDLRRAEVLRQQHDRPIVLFVGRLVYYKGVEVLLEAMTRLDADLVIIGQGPLELGLRERARTWGIEERVTILPPQPDKELTAWYHAAEVFVLPSVAPSEAYGLVQLEAHAAGTPVVSTRLPTGVPFVNPDGVTGFTVPPGRVDELAAAIRRLLDDPGLRARLGATARERVRSEFTIAKWVDRVIEVYQEAIRSRA
jgi:glycosyltransferase involved in cell wall biosynthesis